LDCNTSKARRLPWPKNWLYVCQKTFGPQLIKGQKATMPKKLSPRLPEDLWTATHQRPEGYHAQKTGFTSAKRPLDRNTSKARRLPCPKNWNHVCKKTFKPQNIKGRKAIIPKNPAPCLPEDLWTATHPKPESYHAQKTGSKSFRRLLDHNTSKARRLPCNNNRLHICQKTF
jgi:hypothetical protein